MKAAAVEMAALAAGAMTEGTRATELMATATAAIREALKVAAAAIPAQEEATVDRWGKDTTGARQSTTHWP